MIPYVVLHVIFGVFDCQVDNQLLGTTQPVTLCVTPACTEDTAVDTSPTLQVNAVKVPSELMLTDLFKVTMEMRITNCTGLLL